MSRENPTAAELDRALKARDAYEAAHRGGATEAACIEAAKAAAAKCAHEQFLRSVGVEP